MPEYKVRTQTANPDRFSVKRAIARKHGLSQGGHILVRLQDGTVQRHKITSGLEVSLRRGSCPNPRSPITLLIP